MQRILCERRETATLGKERRTVIWEGNRQQGNERHGARKARFNTRNHLFPVDGNMGDGSAYLGHVWITSAKESHLMHKGSRFF